jgi:hypothetical protein
MIYFDNHPHGHFGTIRQQIWSVLHFPIHLAIVGLVEGAQQVALARYVSRGIYKFEKSLVQYCFKDHLDGADLVDKLVTAVDYFQLDKKLNSLIFVPSIQSDIELIGNTTGICTGVTGADGSDLPDPILHLFANVAAALYSGLGVNIPLDEDVLEVMLNSWKLVYRYFWAAYLILIGCFLVVMVLIRTTKMDAFDITALFDRGFVIVAAAAILGLSAGKDLMYQIIETPFILPIAVILLYLIIVLDRLGAWIANRRNRKSGDPLIGEEEGHGHGHGHKEHGGNPHEADKQSLIASTVPVPPHQEEYNMSYVPLGTSVIRSYDDPTPSPYHPPHPSPPPAGGVPTSTAYSPSGYMPVQNPQYAGHGY